MAKKTSRSCQSYPLRVQTNNFWIEIFFKSFEPFWIFSRNVWHGSQTSIFVSRVKIPEEIFFYSSFHNFYRILCEKFFRLLAEKLQEVFKTTLYSFRGTVCGLNLFFYFRIVLVFLQKPLAWFSKIYLRVQSKNSGRKIFFILLFIIFIGFCAKNFSDFWPKNFKKFSKLPCTRSEEQFVAWYFFFVFESFLIFCRNLSHGSQTSFYVSRGKIPEEIIFLFFFFQIFLDFERKIFQTFGQKTSGIFQNYLLRVLRNSLWPEFFLNFEYFWIFCRNLWPGSQNSIYVFRVKIAEEIIF